MTIKNKNTPRRQSNHTHLAMIVLIESCEDLIDVALSKNDFSAITDLNKTRDQLTGAYFEMESIRERFQS